MIDVTDNLELAKRLEATGYYEIFTDTYIDPEAWKGRTTHELDYVQKIWKRQGNKNCLYLDFELLRDSIVSMWHSLDYDRAVILHSMTNVEVEQAEVMAKMRPMAVEFRHIEKQRVLMALRKIVLI